MEYVNLGIVTDYTLLKSLITYIWYPNYLIFVIEVVTKANYDQYKNELETILKSVSVNFN